MMSQGLILKIHWTLLANQKRDSSIKCIIMGVKTKAVGDWKHNDSPYINVSSCMYAIMVHRCYYSFPLLDVRISWCFRMISKEGNSIVSLLTLNPHKHCLSNRKFQLFIASPCSILRTLHCICRTIIYSCTRRVSVSQSVIYLYIHPSFPPSLLANFLPPFASVYIIQFVHLPMHLSLLLTSFLSSVPSYVS